MEIWLLTIFFLRAHLATAARLIEERAEREALNLREDAVRVCERVMSLNDLKRRLINLRVLYDKLKEGLPAEEFNILRAYAFKGTCGLGQSMGINRMKVLRLVKRAELKGTHLLAALGFDEGRMERDYGAVPLCRGVREKIRRAKLKHCDFSSGAAIG